MGSLDLITKPFGQQSVDSGQDSDRFTGHGLSKHSALPPLRCRFSSIGYAEPLLFLLLIRSSIADRMHNASPASSALELDLNMIISIVMPLPRHAHPR